MLTKSVKAMKHLNTILPRQRCMQNITPQKWDLLTAICVERLPIITPPLNKLEQEFQKLLMQVELERSLKSNHEIRHEDDLKQAKTLKAAKNVDVDIVVKQTAQDYEDASVAELEKFKFASRITEDDKKNNTASLNRKLDKHLLLLVEQNIGSRRLFIPPQGIRENGETLRQTAERILRDVCGNEIKAQIYGNAPAGFYKYRYPYELQEQGIAGAKVFIYWAKYLSGSLDSQKVKFHWLDKQEMKNYLPSDYNYSIRQFLIDDNH